MKRARKYKHLNVTILCIIFVLYLLITILLTVLYEVLPLYNLFGIWGKDSFYETIVTGMYSSLIDFLVFSVLLTFLLSRWETKNIIKNYLDEIEACRFWFSEQAAYKLRSLIRLLQEENVLSLNLTKCYLFNVQLKKTKFIDCQMMGAVLSNSNFEHSEFTRSNLQGAFCEGTAFKSCTFETCGLRLLKCTNANMSSIKMNDCNLEMTDFTKADLRYSILKNCNLKKVIFLDCNLERANLIGCKNIHVPDLIKCQTLKYAKLDAEIIDLVKQLCPSLLE
ncbi:pentapeptide repeat-containing protein [Clostridium minihomine]|uniref:pentapeptide repeat-containing protein n=1 Tax=Clostridium minihomine TaxID=2045012 RepID=UPI0013EA860F|nr:pentapeptide repeat-containing protein [Clostridium minihomine]